MEYVQYFIVIYWYYSCVRKQLVFLVFFSALVINMMYCCDSISQNTFVIKSCLFYIYAGSKEENSSIFTHLSILNMNNTAISEWNELDKLSVIKSVSDVRLASIPLVEVCIQSLRVTGIIAALWLSNSVKGMVVSRRWLRKHNFFNKILLCNST